MNNRTDFKVTDCNPDIIKPTMFETKASYEHFLTGFYAARELQKLKDRGYIILDDGQPIDSNYTFIVSFDEYNGELSMPRLGPHYNNGIVMWLGSTMGNTANTVFVYKKELKDAFGKITYFLPQNDLKFHVKSLTEYQSAV